ncbi:MULTISPECIES: signal peptidase I [Glutamicibacter]|uniref:signal peptidase I n=1 Tax=Glutamicibacter TaxID=1742989 RepID=UPI000EB98AD8|nr:signal peptidase I [Glutamicibacter sp.]HCJ54375.1 signal peptidase I [Glutamicibacter sp.]
MTSARDRHANTGRTIWKKLRSSPWVHLVAAVLLIALVHGFFIKPYVVPSGSMEPTLHTGDRIYVDRIQNAVQSPEHGDVVVFNASESWEPLEERSGIRWLAGAIGDAFGFGPSNHKALVKRAIGLPGDTVTCCSSNGAVEVNGQALDETYVYDEYPFIPGKLDCESKPASRRCFAPINVPAGQYLVMGDHRSNSSDSVYACRQPLAEAGTAQSCARFVQREDIVGEVFLRVWPLSRAGGI